MRIDRDLMGFEWDLMVIYDNWWDALRFHGILWVKIGHAMARQELDD